MKQSEMHNGTYNSKQVKSVSKPKQKQNIKLQLKLCKFEGKYFYVYYSFSYTAVFSKRYVLDLFLHSTAKHRAIIIHDY